MTSYDECPNCENDIDGDSIYRCSKCKKFFCESCSSENPSMEQILSPGVSCPHCKKGSELWAFATIGKNDDVDVI